MHTGFSDRQLRMRTHFIRHSHVESEFGRAGEGKICRPIKSLISHAEKSSYRPTRDDEYTHMARGSHLWATNNRKLKSARMHKIRHLRLYYKVTKNRLNTNQTWWLFRSFHVTNTWSSFCRYHSSPKTILARELKKFQLKKQSTQEHEEKLVYFNKLTSR